MIVLYFMISSFYEFRKAQFFYHWYKCNCVRLQKKREKKQFIFLYKIYYNKLAAWVGWCLLSGVYCILCYFDFKTFNKVRSISLLNWKDCFPLFPIIHSFSNVENTLLLQFCFEILISFVYLKSNFSAKNVKNFFYFLF